MRLEDKVIIVTGSARGIGKTCALSLAKEGASVAVVDVLTDQADETANEIQKLGGKAIAIHADVSSESDTLRIAQETFQKFGRIDVLVNNAALIAGLKRRSFYEIDAEEWDQVFAVNVRGAWLCIKAVFPYMRDQKKGRIVNVSSGTFFSGTPRLAHYVASKGAIVGITRGLSRELGSFNITINALAPGYTLTEASTNANPDKKFEEMMAEGRALKRNEYPHDLIGTVIYLCSQDSDFVTGQTIVVDGGAVLH